MKDQFQPAFPTRGKFVNDDGLTKREYFAAKALGVCIILASSGKINSESTAMEAVKLADALIEALNK